MLNNGLELSIKKDCAGKYYAEIDTLLVRTSRRYDINESFLEICNRFNNFNIMGYIYSVLKNDNDNIISYWKIVANADVKVDRKLNKLKVDNLLKELKSNIDITDISMIDLAILLINKLGVREADYLLFELKYND